MTWRYPQRLLLAGLALGCTFDLLFNGKLPGISVALFCLVLLLGLLFALRWEEARALGANLWLPAALLFFATMCMVRANGFLLFLNISAVLMLLAVMAVLLIQRSSVDLSLAGLVVAPIEAVVMSLYRGGQVTAHVARHDLVAVASPARRQAVPVVRGLLLAVPVFLFFAVLLASADLIFAEWVRYVLRLDILEALGRWLGHSLVILATGFLLAGGLAFTVHKRSTGWADGVASVRLPWFSGVTESLVVLNAVNLLFFLFVLIQLPYLFGGQLNINPQQFTYAEYARRGFAELVFVAILALAMIVVLKALTVCESRRQRMAFSLSGTLLLALTGVMLASAFKRLLLYETAYGFTQMRVYPHVFMVWLGLLLAWFAVTLWQRQDRFAIGLLVAALGFVATLDLLNPDAFIVRQNVQRYQNLVANTASEGRLAREIDARYFAELSEDAVPTLAEVAEQSTGMVRVVLERDLRQRAVEMRQENGRQAWPAFNLSRWRARRLLTERYPGRGE
jgi:hypothetical protein